MCLIAQRCNYISRYSYFKEKEKTCQTGPMEYNWEQAIMVSLIKHTKIIIQKGHSDIDSADPNAETKHQDSVT